MASTDNERLVSQLAALGYKAGPITESTKPVYIRKLKELLEMKKRNSHSSLQPKSLNSKSLLTFSSDESDLDSLDEKATARKLRRRNRLSLPAPNKTHNKNHDDTNKQAFAKIDTKFNDKSKGDYYFRNRSMKQNFLDSSENDSDYADNLKHNSSYSLRTRKINNVTNSKDDSMHKNKDGSKNHSQLKKSLSIINGQQEVFFSQSSNISSYCISMILLCIVILFFIAIGIMYVNVTSKDGKSVENVRPTPSITKNQYKLVILNQLRNKLRQTAGAYDCNSNEDGVKRNMLLSEVEQYLGGLPDLKQSKRSDIKLVVVECLELFFKHPDFGIRLYNASNEPPVDTKLSTVYSLESVSGDKSFTCRLRQAFGVVLYKLLLMTSVLVIVFVCALTVYWQWLKKKRFQNDMLSLIEDIINLLQNHDEGKGYLPIAHVRDMLIPLSERRQKKCLWDAAVKFIHDNDSRIRVECQNIDGEDYQVWRWLQPSTPVRSTPSKKLWHGQAFEHFDGSTNSPPYSLTSCLKVRNMFDPDVEYGDDWHVHIEDAVLEKCEHFNCIVHIRVDTSSREGCVYIKCTNSESAGHVYRELHGWWFDGNLITVRYLRLERYHERFPKAVNARVPLKSSNKKLLFSSST